MKNSRYKFALIAGCLILLWNATSWLVSINYFFTRKQEVVEQRTSIAQERADDLADSIERNLSYLHGIPEVFAQLLRVRNATSRFGPDSTPSSLSLEARKKRWTKDVRLNDLSRYLALAKASLNVDIIYLINAGGDCIAASNWDTPGSTIGTNFVDRDFYQKNKKGQPGMQYAVGKTTNIPGLYFSTPVIIDGHFLGAVVAKTDVPNLSFLIKELDAFVTDENGVIVLARDKNLEMLSLPDGPAIKMPEQKSFARYRRSSFPVLQMGAWGYKEFPSLVRIQNESSPHIFISNGIPKYGLTVYVGEEINDIRGLEQDELWFASLMGISGSVLILIAAGAMLYWNSIKTAKLALDRANMAERRIVSISEDTQQRIGQELHDDVGQVLTGIAFMSETLSGSLQAQGHNDAQVASKITAQLNEAIAKTRNLAQGLFPVEMKEAGLPAMLQYLAKNVAEIYSITCEFIGEGEYRIDDHLVEIHLFRIAQEAVNNAIKHGAATRITLRLLAEPASITLEIADNGSGISDLAKLDASSGSIGMRSMQYRASLLGGFLHIETLPGGGTRVGVHFSV